MEKEPLQVFETFKDPEEYLRYTWIAFTTHLDKPRALWFAVNGEKILEHQEITTTNEEDLLDKLYRKGLGYHIVAMAYLWNNWFEEAFNIEQTFLNRLYWHGSRKEIEFYLIMLIIKNQLAHLQKLFVDVEFKYVFLTHYEVAVSLLQNPNHTITKMDEFVPLVNYVNGLNRTYGDGKLPYS